MEGQYCCKCNGSGSCKRCSCARNGSRCRGCVPRLHGRCVNTVFTANNVSDSFDSSQVVASSSPESPSHDSSSDSDDLSDISDYDVSYEYTLPIGTTQSLDTAELHGDPSGHTSVESSGNTLSRRTTHAHAVVTDAVRTVESGSCTSGVTVDITQELSETSHGHVTSVQASQRTRARSNEATQAPCRLHVVQPTNSNPSRTSSSLSESSGTQCAEQIDQLLHNTRSRATVHVCNDDVTLLGTPRGNNSQTCLREVPASGTEDLSRPVRGARSSILTDAVDAAPPHECQEPPDSFWGQDSCRIAVRMRGIYYEIMEWRRNLFMVPYGDKGTAFVRELARLIKLFPAQPDARAYVWYAVVAACHLLLQQPFRGSRGTTNTDCLGTRLQLWSDGQLDKLLEECRCIQAHLPDVMPNRDSSEQAEVSDTLFAKLVFDGKLGAASHYIAQSSSGGVLRCSETVPGTSKTVREVLQEKHPEPVTPEPRALMPEDAMPPNPTLFRSITAAQIRKLSCTMHGSAGPSGLDSAAWNKTLTSFKAASNDLCTALAAMARCLCTDVLDGRDLEPFVAARLIPLDKNPGVRPSCGGRGFQEDHRQSYYAGY